MNSHSPKINIVYPGPNSRSNRVGRKPASLFVGPNDQSQRSKGLVTRVVTGSHNFKSGEHSEDAIVASSGRLRVEMGAYSNWSNSGVLSRAHREDVPQLVNLFWNQCTTS